MMRVLSTRVIILDRKEFVLSLCENKSGLFLKIKESPLDRSISKCSSIYIPVFDNSLSLFRDILDNLERDSKIYEKSTVVD